MKFTLRDLLWLFVTLALALCWMIERRNLHSCQIRGKQVTEYLERVEDLRVEWIGDQMRINRDLEGTR